MIERQSFRKIHSLRDLLCEIQGAAWNSPRGRGSAGRAGWGLDRAKEPGRSTQLPGLPVTRSWSKTRRGCAEGGGQKQRDRVLAKGSGSAAIPVTQRLRHQAAATAAEPCGCQCSQNQPGCSLSLLRDLGCPLETLRSDPPQHLPALL